MIVVGIDPSINHTGVAVVECKGEENKILHLELLKNKRVKSTERYVELQRIITLSFCKMFTTETKEGYFIGWGLRSNLIPHKIIIEKPSDKWNRDNKNLSSVITLHKAYISIYLQLRRYYGIERIIEKPAPSGYGKNKKGLPTKEQARYILQAHFIDPKDIKRVKNADLNIVDALMLAVWGCQGGG